MMKSILRNGGLLVAALSVTSLPVIAQETDASRHVGIVRQFDSSQDRMTVDKESYRLEPGLAVHDPYGKHVSLEMVHEGMKIRFMSIPEKKGDVRFDVIQEIWITTD